MVRKMNIINRITGLFNQYKGLRREVYVLFFCQIVVGLGALIRPIMSLILNQKMGFDATMVALVTTISGVAILPAQVFGGKIADKFNKKYCLIFCEVVYSIFYIMCGILPLGNMTVVLMIIGYAFQFMEVPVYNALIADVTPLRDRERAFSLVYFGRNLGLIISPTIAGLMVVNYLWLSFIISGIGMAMSALLVLIFMKKVSKYEASDEIAADTKVYEDDKVNIFKVLWDNKLILFFIIVASVCWAAYSQYGTLLSLDFCRIHGDVGAVIYGSVASINCIVVVIFTPVFTKLFSRITPVIKTFLSEVMLFLGYVIFIAFLGNVPFYYVGMLIFTFGEIVTNLAIGPYLAQHAPATHRGRINGIMGLSQNAVSGFFMLIMGVLYDNYGSSSAWVMVFSLLALAMFGSLLLIGVEKRHNK